MNLQVTFRGDRYHDFVRSKTIEIAKRVLGERLESNQYRNLSIHDAKGKELDPILDQKHFTIYLYSGVTGGNGRDYAMAAPNRMYEQKVYNPDDYISGYIYAPSGLGVMIVDPTSEYAVAELMGNTLYVLFDSAVVSGYNANGWYKVFEGILTNVAEHLPAGFPSIQSLTKGVYSIPAPEIFDPYIADLNPAKNEIEMQVNHGTELANQLLNIDENTQADLILNRIAAIPEIKAVRIKGDHLVLETHDMYADDPHYAGDIYHFGKFRINMSFGAGGKVIFKNLTQRPYSDYYGAYGHPHVDRASTGFWCEGEGKAIYPLLKSYEVEASILFCLKAIESVNDDRTTTGNYLQVLRAFPKVTSKTPYPKESAALTPETREMFAKLFSGTKEDAITDLRNTMDNNQRKALDNQRRILRGALASTLKRMLAEKNGADQIVDLIQSQLRVIGEHPQVQYAEITADELVVITESLTTTDSATGNKYRLGSMQLRYNLMTGEIKLYNPHAAMDYDYKIYHSPNVGNEHGYLPLSQLSATLPELLGEFDWETAVILTLEFLSNFDSRITGTSILRKFRLVTETTVGLPFSV